MTTPTDMAIARMDDVPLSPTPRCICFAHVALMFGENDLRCGDLDVTSTSRCWGRDGQLVGTAVYLVPCVFIFYITVFVIVV
jgi:hypothetical protein